MQRYDARLRRGQDSPYPIDIFRPQLMERVQENLRDADTAVAQQRQRIRRLLRIKTGR